MTYTLKEIWLYTASVYTATHLLAWGWWCFAAWWQGRKFRRNPSYRPRNRINDRLGL